MIRSYIRHNKDTTHPDFPHGEFAGYRAGCKCEPCNQANNDKKRIAYQNKDLEKPIIDENFKICGGCEINKPISEFYTLKDKYYGSYCKDCETVRRRKYTYLRQYNLTLEQFEAMIERQNNTCAICFKPFDDTQKEPCVDHCHTTGKVRGLLCTKHNLGIGLFNDDPELLKNAIQYLERSAADCPEGVPSN